MTLIITKRIIFLLVISLLNYSHSIAQTTLAAGDIAFTGYIGHGTGLNTNDEFSFVLLKTISAGTEINFTENGWLSTGSFRSGENTITWTSNSALLAGQEITIVGTTPTLASGAGSAGTTVGTAFGLAANGDQILAYQGTTASPIFITAIHMNVYSTTNLDPVTTTAAAWDGSATNGFSSGLPPGLTTGVNAIWIGTQGDVNSERDNARFVCAGNLTSIASVKALIFDQTKWQTSDNEPVGFTLPTGCNFSTPLPIKLIDFKAQNTIADVKLFWTTAEQIDFSHFELERSFDGVSFNYLNSIAALNGNATIDYNYTDKTALVQNAITIYYRLKMIDNDGKFTYSNIVKIINNKLKEFEITNFQNPLLGNKINFSIYTKSNKNIAISITDLYGRKLYDIQQKCFTGINNISLPNNLILVSGIYFLNTQLQNEPKQSIKFIKN